MTNISTSNNRFNIKSIIRNIFIVLCLFPFIQTSYNIFNPTYNNIILVYKLILLAISSGYILFKEKTVDKFLIIIFLCNFYMLLPTFLNHGNYMKFLGYFIDSVGLVFMIKYLIKRFKNDIFSGVEFFCRLMIYMNFILLLIYPDGVFTENNGFLVTRYLLLGMDNQASILLISFMIIILACNKNKKSLVLKVDSFIFLLSMILVWCANSIVGILVFIGALFYQKISNKKITIKTCVRILAFMFVFVILLQGFNLFSVFIVKFLGKDMTLSGRTMIWAEGIKEWLKYPILGHGYQASEAFVRFSNIAGYVRGAHNQVLNILLHGGLLFLLGFYYMFSYLDKCIKKYKDNRVINLMVLGVLVNFIMWSADTYGHMVSIYLLISMLYYSCSYLINSKEICINEK